MFQALHDGPKSFELLEEVIEETLYLVKATQDTYNRHNPGKNGLSFADALAVVQHADKHWQETEEAAKLANAKAEYEASHQAWINQVVEDIKSESSWSAPYSSAPGMGLFQHMPPEIILDAFSAPFPPKPPKPRKPDVPKPGKDD